MIPLILIPGHLCGGWLYPDGMVPAVYAPGPLADTMQDDTIQAMADRVIATAPPRFALAGLSMGGMVAMEVMVRAPERVLGACLMDTDPTPARPREVTWRNDLLDQSLATYVETFVGRFFLHTPDTPWAARTREAMSSIPETVARAQAHALDQRRDMLPLIGGFYGPVDVIVGAEDRVCPPMLHHELATALPKARLTEIPNCGHIATLERPEIVHDRLACLAGRIDAGGNS